MQKRSSFLAGLAGLLAAATALPAFANGEVNLYSSRHYDTDERLYSDFTAATGITVNRVEGKENELIERLKAEGANSPADVFITVDAGRIWSAQQDGLFQPIQSEVLNAAIPAELREPEGHWYAFSMRARVIYYDTTKVNEPPKTYEELADPKWKGKVCVRSATNIYQLSLLAAIIETKGEEAAKSWAQGLKDNLVREPEGGDTDQIKLVAAGGCEIALANSYYWGRALRKGEEWAVEAKDRIGVVFPNQEDRGTHVNISGAGVAANAPNKDNAIKFLEYLASESAQKYFADGNDEYPVVAGVTTDSPIQQLGTFKSEPVNVAVYGKNQAKAQEIWNAVGFK
ncbi:MAG: Fe(3+) ABC transporter substrate-binding protein [Rhizobiaceae bacterium]|jgi:iron(III) transport system substrate-binding protein|nr:Fe(3+) ABC transporter substrate-binding protein [Rhizobiaceae bacterium]